MRGSSLLLGAALALAALGSSARAQAAAPAGAWAAVTLPGASQLDLRARANDQRYRIFVAVPPGPVPAQGYPVLYVLDGNAAFPLAAFLARSAASRREVTGHVPPLVVGIGYPGEADFDVPARQRDYTPAAASAQTQAPGAGGAAQFLDFIELELKPLIAARYRSDPQRQALFGHSFGGLFVLHALASRPAAFSTYLASSPSLWWDEQQLLRSGLPAVQALDPAAMPRVQISVGTLEDQAPPGRLPPDMLALFNSRPMLAPARQLAARLHQLPGMAERLAFHELAGENHGGAWLPALSRGLQFFLDQPEAGKPPSPR